MRYRNKCYIYKNFLLLEEVEIKPEPERNNRAYIRIENFTKSWKSSSSPFALRDINLNFSDGKLYVITGPVGSGKSSLLKAILGELQTPDSGAVHFAGRLSYAGQQAWLFAGCLRDNLLLGEAPDPPRLARVLETCALAELSERAQVGERGCALSGGQAARLGLARAVYREADVYLIDDALAALDVQVGRHVFNSCINGLLKGKLRILVSHNVEHFRKADVLVVMKDGRVDFCGSYADLTAKAYSLPELPNPPVFADKPLKENENTSQNEFDVTFIHKQSVVQGDPKENDELTGKRDRNDPVYWRYLRAGGSNLTILCLALSLMFARGSLFAYDYWLAHWLKREESRNKTISLNDDYSAALEFKFSLYIFAALLLTSVITWTASSLLFYKVCVNASRNLHKRMFSRLLRAPMRFFELNPSGRILNRFSKDIGLVDETLPTVTLDGLHVVLMMVGVATQILIINWLALFPIGAMGVVCWKLQAAYLPTAQFLKRLESKAKSPVFSHVSSTLVGLPTIRSARAQGTVRADFDARQDAHSSALYLGFAASSAYGLWLDLVSVSLLAFVVLGLLVMGDGETRAATAGLAISQALMLYGSVQYGLRQIAEMLTQMVGVERIFQFVDLEEEGPFWTDAGLEEDWPSEGGIKFDGVVLRYGDDEEPALKGIHLEIQPREKVGIVGRTGAGKTSLISTLFQLARPEGSIYIDDVEVKTIGLHELRRRISLIPQEPVIFTASVRDNLDPLGAHDDAALWRALESAGLRGRFDSLERRLANGGAELSAGQRQLFCLARVMLADNKILVLDEATANVDAATDAALQEIVGKRFADCTVLTVAHRPDTVSRCDRIVVMDRGRIVESGDSDVLESCSFGA